MKNLFNTAILTLATTLTLTACGGGSSDSSGNFDSFDVGAYQARLVNLPSCQIDHTLKIIHAGKNGKNDRISQLVPQECKVKLPDVNGGYAFSLKCQSYVSLQERPTVSYYATKKYESSVINLIKNGKTYHVACVK
ncbi:hypothetical protein [Moraxella boevrei]|uniref:hypothetical protein n=1 Tax=Faucicola boevrei TaxID=346665 RepID=UPI003735A548